MKSPHNRKPEQQTKIALERIGVLFQEAETMFKEHPELSKRYMELARKIAMKYKVKFTKEQKLKFCKNCNAYLKQGINSTKRLNKGILVIRCKECGGLRRIKYK